MTSIISHQASLNAGELSPSLFARNDFDKYHAGTSTCRNFFVNYQGGITSRGGLAYVGMCKQQYPNPAPRDIPFLFSLSQGYVLEFGEVYMRVKTNGAYVTETPKTVTSVSSAGLFTTSTSHGYSVGDWVYDTGNTGFSGLTWIVHSTPTGSTFTVTDLFGNIVSSATASSGGTVARIYTVVSPYSAIDLPWLKYTQSADVMTLTCVNQETNTEYPPYDLVRNSNTNWVFTQETFAASISAPTNLTAVAQSSSTLSTWYSYVVTAVDSTTGEESVASTSIQVQNNDISLFAGSNILSWTPVSGAASYNVYAAIPAYSVGVPASSLFGFIGTALGPSFTDTNITPDFTVVPPTHANPFARGAITNILPTAGGSNYSQSTIGYSITTSTGSGFSGTPVVNNGKFGGFVITNPGQGYKNTDTVTITDSGGGVAIGNFVFSGNPADASNVFFNGQEIFFKTSPASPVDCRIESTLALTLQTLANILNSSTDLSISVATYSSDSTHLYVTYKTPGSVGNAYTLANGSGTTNATPSGTNLTGGGTVGSGATGTISVSAQSGTYPNTCAYFQERRVYSGSTNDPDTYWMSKPGLYSNMDSSIPTVASDAITGTPWAQQVNGIQYMLPMPGGLVVLTGLGAWQVNGGSQTAVTPSNQVATPQAYNGCHFHVPPIQINYDILYVQSKGSIIRDLSYNFFVNIYTGTDLTVLSNHLFNGYQVQYWTWAQEPYKLVWVVRNDGVLLCLTYLKEQEIFAWTRHDTNGKFICVASVPEQINPNISQSANFSPALFDAVYVITLRYVQGAWRYYSERMDARIWDTVEDSFCVDAGLAYPQTHPNASLTASANTGIVTFTASSSVFSSGNVGDVIRMGGGIATVTGYTSGTVVTGTLTQDITDVAYNDPNDTPLPQSAGTWSISTPTTTVSGLNHLEGLTVSILADGSVVPNQVVTNNSVTLPAPASNIIVGLPFTCQAQTLYMDHPAPGGNTVQNRRKIIDAVGLTVETTRGIQIGSDQPDQSTQQDFAQTTWTNMTEPPYRTPQVFAGQPIPLYTGEIYVTSNSSWSPKGQIAVQQVYPLPATILGVQSFWFLGDDR